MRFSGEIHLIKLTWLLLFLSIGYWMLIGSLAVLSGGAGRLIRRWRGGRDLDAPDIYEYEKGADLNLWIEAVKRLLTPEIKDFTYSRMRLGSLSALVAGIISQFIINSSFDFFSNFPNLAFFFIFFLSSLGIAGLISILADFWYKEPLRQLEEQFWTKKK